MQFKMLKPIIYFITIYLLILSTWLKYFNLYLSEKSSIWKAKFKKSKDITSDLILSTNKMKKKVPYYLTSQVFNADKKSEIFN